MTDAAAVAEARAQTYWWLAGFYLTRPDAGMLEALSGSLRREAHGAGDPQEAEALAALAQALTVPDREALAERLAVEWTRLFRGIQEGYGPPPPYESLHREGRITGESTLAVLGRYAEAGFSDIEPAAGPQDHLGVELRFMALLCFKEGAALARGQQEEADVWRRRQIGVLEEHLLRWVPGYAQLIARETREPFYGAIARLTALALVQDREALSEAAAAGW